MSFDQPAGGDRVSILDFTLQAAIDSILASMRATGISGETEPGSE
jgi:hypothetical protein